jgi:ABC-type uncharacterized transport system ATPase subunit
VLLVEHDMTLVRQVCGYIYVLDFGQLIFEGTPDGMRSSDQVRAAYLGSDTLAVPGDGDTVAVPGDSDGSRPC